MPPTWLETVAWVSLALGAGSAALILWDILGRGYRQPMRVMEAVWPITALYLGPLAWWAYRRWGRTSSAHHARHHGDAAERPFAVRVGIGATHCGAGCTLGDIVATWIVFALGLAVAGLALPYEYAFDFTFAFALGVAFQYWAIRPMRADLARGEVLRRAVKADALSLTAFEVGLFGWMAIVQLVLFAGPHLPPDTASYWLLMQVGMALGLLTTYPVNVWLIRRGVKEAM